MNKTHFEVEMRIGDDNFENIWTDTERETGKETPTTFATFDEAQEAINEFMRDQAEAVECGFMDTLYDEDDFIITEQDTADV